jgi:hypothetical protein
MFHSLSTRFISCTSSEIIDVLNELSVLSYPAWMTNAVPYLPSINLQCVATSGIEFLEEAVENNDMASISGVLDAIARGCSTSNLSLSGGYDSETQELEINVIVMLGSSKNV